MQFASAIHLTEGFAALVVLVIGFMRVIRPRTWFVLAFVAAMAASTLIFVTPTPPGYDPNNSSRRIGGGEMAFVGPRVAGVLFAISLAAVLAGSGVRRTVHHSSQLASSAENPESAVSSPR
jgi:hypothetical protein